MKKSVFVVISKDIIRRNILETDFLDTFLAALDNETKIVLIVSKGEEESYQKYVSDRVLVDVYERVPHTGFQKLLNFLIRTGINSHSTRTYRNRALQRGECSLLSYFVKAFVANSVGRFACTKKILRRLFINTAAPRAVYDLLDTYEPKAVFAPSLIDNEFDAQFSRVAKQRGVPLLGMVRSWDNLNNHGVLSVIPDVFYFQNTWLVSCMENFQGINVANIPHSIVGLPHYDTYKDPSDYIQKRKEFFDDIGLDPNKKLILLGGSDFYYSEDTLPAKIDGLINDGHITQSAQVMFRPHPSSLFDIKEYGLESLRSISIDNAFTAEKKFTDTEKFINLLYYSDVIINIASTLSIDAAVFNKPTICINFDDSNRRLSHFESVHRLYDHFDHYERLVATGGVLLPKSVPELADAINSAFENPTLHQKGRKEIIEQFVSPFDGQAGFRLGNLVADECNKAVTLH